MGISLRENNARVSRPRWWACVLEVFGPLALAFGVSLVMTDRSGEPTWAMALGMLGVGLLLVPILQSLWAVEVSATQVAGPGTWMSGRTIIEKENIDRERSLKRKPIHLLLGIRPQIVDRNGRKILFAYRLFSPQTRTEFLRQVGLADLECRPSRSVSPEQK